MSFGKNVLSFPVFFLMVKFLFPLKNPLPLAFFFFTQSQNFEDVGCKPMIVNPSVQKPTKKKQMGKIHREREN